MNTGEHLTRADGFAELGMHERIGFAETVEIRAILHQYICDPNVAFVSGIDVISG